MARYVRDCAETLATKMHKTPGTHQHTHGPCMGRNGRGQFAERIVTAYDPHAETTGDEESQGGKKNAG